MEDSQLRISERYERLMLIMALALYWAVSTGMWDAKANPSAAEKKPELTSRQNISTEALYHSSSADWNG